jgi:hypothetical protein
LARSIGAKANRETFARAQSWRSTK